MTLAELRARAYHQLGERLERATPHALRAFLDEVEAEAYPHHAGRPVELHGPMPTFEQTEREFFARVLRSADERNFVTLWLMAAEFWAASLEERESERHDAE